MNVDEATDIIAKYLTGGPSGLGQLREACGAVNNDGECSRFFSEEFGLAGPPENFCEKFCAHVAELAEMSRAQRDREMPEFVRHADRCALCRRLFWDVRDPWISQAVAVATAKGRHIVRSLAEGLRLAVGKAGEIIQYGLGPPSVVCPAIAGTNRATGMGNAPADSLESASEERVWTLEDEVSGAGHQASDTYKVKITIRVWSVARGKALVACAAEGIPETDLSAVDLVISGRRSRSLKDVEGLPYRFKGKMADYQNKPVDVPFGEYVICLAPEGSRPSFAWEIPLSIDTEGKP